MDFTQNPRQAKIHELTARNGKCSVEEFSGATRCERHDNPPRPPIARDDRPCDSHPRWGHLERTSNVRVCIPETIDCNREAKEAIAVTAVDVYESVAYTAPGIVAHQSALKGGELLKIPDFGRG